MGVNLIPKVEGNFEIETKEFSSGSTGDRSVDLGCIGEGKHRVLRFDLQLHNIGDEDLVIGHPKDRPDLFVHSDVFTNPPYQFKEKFYTWKLNDEAGVERKRGYKVAFCLMDQVKYTCTNQGISINSYDVYGARLYCQFVEIDNIPEADYVLEVTANAFSVDAVKSGRGKPLIEEDNYDDNTTSVHLHIPDIAGGMISPK